MISTAIVGTAGYTGQETLDRVLSHPGLELVALGSDTFAGKPATVLDSRIARTRAAQLELISNDAALASGAELIFLCMENERAAAVEPPPGATIVDLSGAHRLKQASAYERWYGFVHPKPGELDEWCFALPELAPPSGHLIANPGCYVTATLLALVPIKDSIDQETVVVDGKSGMTGAGRGLKPSLHAGAVLENVSPYKVGFHQHVPEMALLLGFAPTFVPHLLPLRRGLICTCYVRGIDAPSARAQMEAAYRDSPLVNVLPEGIAPEIGRVQKTDYAEINVFADTVTGATIVICALDNLGKGAAGQAVQNANLALGLDETAGLRTGALNV
ncbi:MAG: N-acetyl-gamma-glutamyl-phosphate reductase [Gaiellaceae bacterium]|jgi:N-acetyl-gamma-glutamyl-phosphate reductase